MRGIQTGVRGEGSGPGFKWNGKIVLIGASTGGVEALEGVLSGFPDNCPPTLISQHMPERYLRAFSKRLNQNIRPAVTLAREGARLEQGYVYLAPGGASHLEIICSKSNHCHLRNDSKVNGHRPSVDVMFHSAVKIADSIVAVLLTGMGRDGAQGLLSLRKSGAVTIGQDETSCVVYGMPRVAAEIGAVMYQTALPEISTRILENCTLKPAGQVGI